MNFNRLSLIYSVLFLSLVGCTPPVTNTLLSDGSSQCGDTGCNTSSSQTSIEGSLSIDPELSEATWNVNKSDLFEISGTCKDLGRKNNRILVQVFHREDDQSILPYIDNSISNLCQTTDAGIATTEQCIFVSHGNSLIEDTQLYPQCINGRFSFQIRLGAIIEIASVRKHYFARMKLRTTDGITSDSGWAEVTIKRGLSAPNFSVTANLSEFKCEVKTSAYKFKHPPFAAGTNPNIQYAVFRDTVGYTAAGAESRSGMTSRFLTPANYSLSTPITEGDSVANFCDGGTCPTYVNLPSSANFLAPGMKYIYNVSAILGTTSVSSDSTAACEMLPPFVTGSIVGGTSCQMTIATGSNPSLSYEWIYKPNSGWTSTQSSAGGVAIAGSSAASTFDMTALAPATYYVAVRANDGTRYGKWSNEFPCRRQ